MIEIIALIFILRHIGKMAKSKGLSAMKWRLNTLAYWIAFEIPGFLIGYSISHNIYTAMPLGLGFAFGGYLLMKYQLSKYPDPVVVPEHWMDRLGKDDQ